ncbi:MAG: von Willebrand factor type A domain protein [Lentisphaerae bacterium ADurb.Bin082]|nr:MAG: von Willebrand factor type A domain protein [Lentisphaerae bacterium ADurb.Bin082]
MSPIWQSLPMLHLLWLLPAFCLLFVYAGAARQRALRRFAESEMLSRLLAKVSPARRRWKQALWLLALASLILALARPCWNPVAQEVKRQGRDVVFVLDVSRSMLADDLKPNRLERAKLAINDCLEVLEGDRVGLLVFAGTSLLRCPLTLDYGFFRLMLADVDPTTVSRGGTKIGDALRKVMSDVFDSQVRQCKDVVLITDGEDQDTFPVEAAQKLGEEGIRLLAIGLGDENQGTPIMVTDEQGQRTFLMDKGEMVRSRLDGDTLREMVAKTPGGKYLPVGTGNFDLGSIYRSLIATAEQRELESQTIERYEEKFQVFLGLSLVFLLVEGALGERKRQA